MEAIPKESRIIKEKHDIDLKNCLFYDQIKEDMLEIFKKSAETLWNKDIPDAKYKIGEVVFFKHRLMCGYEKIIGVNNTGDGIEYCLENVPVLLWEEELENDDREER